MHLKGITSSWQVSRLFIGCLVLFMFSRGLPKKQLFATMPRVLKKGTSSRNGIFLSPTCHQRGADPFWNPSFGPGGFFLGVPFACFRMASY